MACNETVRIFKQAISYALQRLETPSMVLYSFNSPLALRTHAVVIVQRSVVARYKDKMRIKLTAITSYHGSQDSHM